MNLNKIPLMNAIADKLSWLSRRQEIISENVSNANTTGYKSRAIEEIDFKDILQSTQKNGVKTPQVQLLRSNNPKHLTPHTAKNDAYASVVDKTATDSGIGGNTVVLEEQMMKMAETQIEYSTMINLYRRHMSLVKTALGSRGR